MIVATAGHVDHGKTTLVRALTGVDTDRLPEEKRRGISIDLGFAYLPVEGRLPVAFVDVPGHERFLRNMVAGIQAIDLALLVVAADDGPMPQTLEHLAILRQLGVAEVWAFISKLDRVDEARARAVRAEVARLLPGAPVYEDAERLRAGLLEKSNIIQVTADPREGFRMPIDRCFILDGLGLVVTGTVLQGTVRTGDELTVMPRGLTVRVRSLRANDSDAPAARGGERCALGLQGASREEIARGDVLAAGAPLPRTRRVDLRLCLEPDVPLRTKRPVVAHFGTASCEGQLACFSSEGGFARLTLAREVTLWHGDRLLLRDPGTGRLLGGGSVVDALPPSRGAAKPEHLARLAQIENASALEALDRLVERPGGSVSLHWLSANWQLPLEAMADAAAAKGLRRFGMDEPLVTSAATWTALRAALREEVARHHAEHPGEMGPALALLRERFAPQYGPTLLMAVLQEAVQDGELLRWGAHYRLPGHQPALSPGEEALWVRVKPRLAPTDAKPARVHELAEALGMAPKDIESFLVRACHAGRAMRVARNRFFPPETVERMVELARTLDTESDGEGFSAAQFRDRSGLGRNLTIEVLEFLDQCGYTRRRQDRRRMIESTTEEKRTPVGRPDFKSGERRLTSLGGSTPSSSATTRPMRPPSLAMGWDASTSATHVITHLDHFFDRDRRSTITPDEGGAD